MNNYKKVNIKNDPWSQKFIESIKNSPHYKTLLLLKENPNIKLEDTPYYEFLKIEGKNWKGLGEKRLPIINNYDDMVAQFNKFKNLLKIAPNWNTKEEILKVITPNGSLYFGDYPAIIFENGEIGLLDGHHRIAIQVFLNLPIKVTICDRELKWSILVEELKSLYPDNFLYQPIPHPDFEDWDFSRNNEKETYLKRILTQHNLKYVIDLGTCHGYSFYGLKDIIKRGIGVEYHPIRFKIAKLLLYYLGFSCYNEDMFSFMKRYHDTVDCIFALAVFHHFLRENSLGKFEDLLKYIAKKTKFLIYELPRKDEIQNNWIPHYLHIDSMIEEITQFKKIEEITLTNQRVLKILKNEKT